MITNTTTTTRVLFCLLGAIVGISAMKQQQQQQSPRRRIQQIQQIQQPCSVCVNGTDMAFPERIVADTGVLAGRTCQEMNVMLGWLYPNASHPECQTIQSLGSLCGCPTQTHNTCDICQQQQQQQQDETTTTIRPNNKDLPFLANLFGGEGGGALVPTCATLQAYFRSVNNSADTELCLTSQYFMADYCGCQPETTIQQPTTTTPPPPPPPCSLCPQDNNNSSSLVVREKAINIANFPFATCGALEDAIQLLLFQDTEQCNGLQFTFAIYCGCQDRVHPVSPCTLCADGSVAPWPDKPVTYLADTFEGIAPTCSVLEASILSMDANDNVCGVTRLTSSYCGCPAIPNHCEYCPDENRTQFPAQYQDKLLPHLGAYDDAFAPITITCEVAWFTQFQIPGDDEQCYLANEGTYLCGCNNGEQTYFDADTPTKRLVLVWLPRLSASLSMLGSLAIVFDVLGSSVRRRKAYNRLVLGISCADLFVSLAWMASTAPIPRYDQFGDASSVPGSIGSNVSCKIQGLFMEFLVMSTFYNGMLSFYYLLVIVYGWSEARIGRIQVWLHGIPIGTGLAFALGGLPYYRSVSLGCHISVPPHETSWFPTLFFVTVPSLTVTIAASAMIVRVYLKVRNHQRLHDRWRFPTTTTISTQDDLLDNHHHHNNTGSDEIRRIHGGSRFKRRSSTTSLTSTTTTTTSSSRLEDEVFWQAVWYLAAFYITNVTQFAVALVAGLEFETGVIQHDLYGLWVTHVVLAPLQGLWNSLIYFRPRLVGKSETAAKARRRASLSVQRRSSTSSANNNNGRVVLPTSSSTSFLQHPPNGNALHTLEDDMDVDNNDNINDHNHINDHNNNNDQEDYYDSLTPPKNTDVLDCSGSTGIDLSYRDPLDNLEAFDGQGDSKRRQLIPEWMRTSLRRDKLDWDGSFY